MRRGASKEIIIGKKNYRIIRYPHNLVLQHKSEGKRSLESNNLALK